MGLAEMPPEAEAKEAWHAKWPEFVSEMEAIAEEERNRQRGTNHFPKMGPNFDLMPNEQKAAFIDLWEKVKNQDVTHEDTQRVLELVTAWMGKVARGSNMTRSEQQELTAYGVMSYLGNRASVVLGRKQLEATKKEKL